MQETFATAGLFLIAMSAIFSLPYLAWRLARSDYLVPLVIVQILAGIALGPAFAGRAFPELHSAVFTEPVNQALDGVAWWAVALFVWLAGIELDFKQAWANRRECLVTASLALVVPLLLGCLVALALVADARWVGPLASEWQFTLAVGMACAVTALPVLIMLLEKLAILRAPLGQRALRYASLDDLAIWAVLAVILMDLRRVGAQCAFLAAFVAVSFAYRGLMRRLPAEDRWYVGVIWLLVSACAAEWAGLHFMIGAFLAGVVSDSAWFDEKHTDPVRRSVLLFLMPVYFLSAGLKTAWGIDGATVFLIAGLLLAAAVAGKLAGVWLAGRILGWRPGDAALIGWLLQTKGLIMIVFAGVLLDVKIVTPETFTALLLMAIASTILTVPLVAPRLARRGARDGG